MNRSLKIVDSAVFYHYRRENPEFDRYVAATIVGSNSRGQQIRYARERTRIRIAARREEANDYQKIRSMVPGYFPEPDEIGVASSRICLAATYGATTYVIG